MSKVKMEFNEDAINELTEAAANELAKSGMFDIECPHCHKAINIPIGKHPCPSCGNEIDLALNFRKARIASSVLGTA